jgi:hypothetical protein
MTSAFQQNAFQDDAFQIDGVTPPTPTVRPGAGNAARRKPRRTLVEIDGETFTVRSVAEAEALLAQARATAEEVAPRVAKTALNKARDVERKTGKLPTLEVAVPELKATGDDEIAALFVEAQRGVDEIYLRAAQAAELAWLARRAYYEQDEDDAMILLLH